MSHPAPTDSPGGRERSVTDAVIAELHRRNVFRVATAYAVVAFVLLQVAEITFEPLQAPAWALTALILLVLLAFPVVMALAWTFDLTPQGLRRTEANEDTSRVRSLALLALVVGLDLAAAFFLYRVYGPGAGWPGGPSVTGSRAGALVADGAAGWTPPPRSVAVLPFRDLSPGADDSYFADGVSAEIQALLSGVQGLRVPARTFAFRGSELELSVLGRRLNVARVLEGTVRVAGDRVFVTAQLVDVLTGYADWSSRFERPVDEILAVQDEIVAAVVEQLTGRSDRYTAADPGGRAPSSFEAFDRYLEGRELWRRRTPASLRDAIEAFEAVIELDPSYAPAYAGLADAYLLLASYGNLSAQDAIRKAEPLVRAALELDGQLSEGFASLGLLNWNAGRYRMAEGHLRRAIDLDEDNVVAYVWLAGLVAKEGRYGEQEAILRRGLEKDPLNLLLNINLASNQLARGRVEDGLQRLEETRQSFPTSTLVLRTLAEWLASRGRADEALAVLDEALLLAPEEPPNHTQRARLLMALGALEPAAAAVRRAKTFAPDNEEAAWVEADYLWRTGRHRALADRMEGLLEGSSETPGTRSEGLMPAFWLARLRLAADEPAAALEYLAHVLVDADALPPLQAVDLLTWKALAQASLGGDASAEDDLARAERHVAALGLQGLAVAELAYLDGVLQALRGRPQAALARLEEAYGLGWYDAWELEHDGRLATVWPAPTFDRLVARTRERNRAALAAASVDLAQRQPEPAREP